MPSEESLFQKIKRMWKTSRESKKTNSILLYLTCMLISFFFWLFLSLNSETQKDLSIPFNLSSLPDSTTIISGLPKSIDVSVRDKGSSLLKFDLGNIPTFSLDFLEYFDGSGNLKVSSIDMLAKVRRLFSNTTTVVTVIPDSLNIKYTNLPGKKVPIVLNVDITPNFRYVINGEIKKEIDSVVVYSDKYTLEKIKSVSTEHIVESAVNDTLIRKVKFASIPGAKIIPGSMSITVPVEPLINKKQSVQVDVVNVPEGVNVITFPSVVDASFLVPQSMFYKSTPVKVIANYNDILYSSNNSNKVAVKIIEVPVGCKDISLAIDSVEYIIEKY